MTVTLMARFYSSNSNRELHLLLLNYPQQPTIQVTSRLLQFLTDACTISTEMLTSAAFLIDPPLLIDLDLRVTSNLIILHNLGLEREKRF